MLALIKDNQIISKIYESGWFELPNGDRGSPARDGWTDGEYTLMRIQNGDPVPEGQEVKSVTVEMVNGVPTYVNHTEAAAEPIPERVTSRQFKLQLLADDLIDSVEAWIATQSRDIQIAYESSGTFVKTEPMMQSGFAALGFTSEQIDNFFVEASKL
jgi:hypothetical protein